MTLAIATIFVLYEVCSESTRRRKLIHELKDVRRRTSERTQNDTKPEGCSSNR